jgi:hypothetical protein
MVVLLQALLREGMAPVVGLLVVRLHPFGGPYGQTK